MPAVITQNIDGLHQASGVPADGSSSCMATAPTPPASSCGRRHELGAIRPASRRRASRPTCVACGGIVKSATISFGQAMPAEADAAGAGAGARLRPLPRPRLVARGLSGGRISARWRSATAHRWSSSTASRPTFDDEADLVIPARSARCSSLSVTDIAMIFVLIRVARVVRSRTLFRASPNQDGVILSFKNSAF